MPLSQVSTPGFSVHVFMQKLPVFRFIRYGQKNSIHTYILIGNRQFISPLTIYKKGMAKTGTYKHILTW